MDPLTYAARHKTHSNALYGLSRWTVHCAVPATAYGYAVLIHILDTVRLTIANKETITSNRSQYTKHSIRPTVPPRCWMLCSSAALTALSSMIMMMAKPHSRIDRSES
jgi:hypothetical protein